MKSFVVALFALALPISGAAAAQATEPGLVHRHDASGKPFPPVAVSPLATSVIAEPAAVFTTDARWYLVYEISLLNVTPTTQRVDRVDVLQLPVVADIVVFP